MLPALPLLLHSAAMTKTKTSRKEPAAPKAPAAPRRKAASAKAGAGGRKRSDAEPNVGAYLRLLRHERGLSLADLSATCGVSRAMLSQIEQGRSSPSIALGWKIANGLGVPFGALLGEPGEGDFVVQRAQQTREVFSTDRALRSRPLFPSGNRRVPELYELTLRAGGVEDAHAHELGTRELLYVEAGELTVTSAGQRAELGPGDTLFFRADQPHRYANPGAQATRCYLVMCYPARPSSDAEPASLPSPVQASPVQTSPVQASPESPSSTPAAGRRRAAKR